MYSYIKGVVTGEEKNTIILENNGIGYEINVPIPMLLKRTKNKKFIFIIILEKMKKVYMAFKQKKKKNCF